jgi:hypothetical protein
MNFNRRQNRIAGPGFHINVRYDDQNMAMAHSNNNQSHEKVRLGSTRVENFDVKEQELLVCKRKSTMYHDGYTHCFSSVNGFPESDKITSKDPEEVAEAILKQVHFVGVATTEYKPSKAYSEQGFVAQVGGVTTLINESEKHIKPGQSVALGLNLRHGRKTTRDKGIPRDKIRFCVVPVENKDVMIREALSEMGGAATKGEIKKLQAAVDSADKALKAKPGDESLKKVLDDAKQALKSGSICKAGTEGLKEFLNIYQQLNERVIGKAASYAKPGDRLEVILQPRNPY